MRHPRVPCRVKCPFSDGRIHCSIFSSPSPWRTFGSLMGWTTRERTGTPESTRGGLRRLVNYTHMKNEDLEDFLYHFRGVTSISIESCMFLEPVGLVQT